MDEEESSDEEDEEEQEKEEEFYTEGDDALEAARRWLTAYSLPRAKRRILRQREEANTPLGRILDVRKSVFAELKVSWLFKYDRNACSSDLLKPSLMYPANRPILHSARSLQTSVPCAACAFRLIASTSAQARGAEQSRSGMFQDAQCWTSSRVTTASG